VTVDARIPKSMPDFHRMFPDERACETYLEHLRWPTGFKCDHCGHRHGWWIGEWRRYDCAKCRRASYLTAGTVMHKSHTPLMIWFYGAFYAGTLTPGISAIQFQRQLGLSRYETAFNLLHKLRHGMVNPDRGKLEGTVQIDETFMGGVRVGEKGGRSVEFKTAVIGAVEVHPTKKGGERAGRIRLHVVPNTGKRSCEGFVKAHVEEGSTVVTDGWIGYEDLPKLGYDYQPTIIGDERAGAKHLRLVHLEISNFKTYIRGTYHGRVERQHLQAYCNEFMFRHNRRFFAPGFGFLRMLELGSRRKSPTYRQLYEADEYGRDVHMNGLGLPAQRRGTDAGE
jgi:transposase-like protein